MNAALLLLSSAWVAGADTPPPAAAAPAPVMAAPAWPAPAGGCADCAAGPCPGASDPCPCEKKGLFGKKKKGGGCDCSAPEPRKGIFHGFTTAACDGCGGGHLFGKLKSKFHHGGYDVGYGGYDAGWGGGCGAPAWGGAPAVGGCALPPVPGTAPLLPPATAPQQMPQPANPPKSNGTGSSAYLPLPSAVAPAGGPILGGSRNPF